MVGALLLVAALLSSAAPAPAAEGVTFPVPGIPCAPRTYVCFHAPSVPAIDGRLDDPAWQAVAWTEDFTDIEGPLKPGPQYRTRARMLWDERCLYIAAEMEEPDLWATLTKHDDVIYRDHDFEVFIDPDGDTHQYYELEVNALNTTWDLLLIKPYRDGGPAVNAWEITGLETAVSCDGTLNDPRDRDRGWSVEIAIPWTALRECTHVQVPPTQEETWRINFSRVEWHLQVVDGAYGKQKNKSTGKDLPEENWTWSPQGLIAMHYPEMWGRVQFSGAWAGTPDAQGIVYRPNPDDPRWWELRQAYYAERDLQTRRGAYSDDRLELGRIVRGQDPRRANLKEDVVLPVPALVRLTQSGFEATQPGASGSVLHIREDGRIWRTAK
jgi:hypothetical protein